MKVQPTKEGARHYEMMYTTISKILSIYMYLVVLECSLGQAFGEQSQWLAGECYLGVRLEYGCVVR